MLRWVALGAALLAFGPTMAAAQTLPLTALYINDRYDPRADPYADLDRAIDRAEAENKRVLVVVGGDWCGWCQVLDNFLTQHVDIRAAFERSFVMVKVHYSAEQRNVAFLSGFPPSRGYPDFFVLDSNGAFLRQQDTSLLEGDGDYDHARMAAFAQRWRP